MSLSILSEMCMQFSLSEQLSLLTSMKAAFGCSPANMAFYAERSSSNVVGAHAHLKQLQKWDKACDKIGRAFFVVTEKTDITTYDQLQKSVAVYFGWFAWIFLKWAAPRILAFLWNRTYDKRPF